MVSCYSDEGYRISCPQICYFGIRLFWAEKKDIWKVPCTPCICFKAGYKSVKMSLSPFYQEGQTLTTGTTRDPHKLRDDTRGIYITFFAKTSPHLPLIFSYICLSIICCPKISKVLILCLEILYKIIVLFLLRCHISQSFNHSFELLIEYSHVSVAQYTC